jgi:hypothetical protein
MRGHQPPRSAVGLLIRKPLVIRIGVDFGGTKIDGGWSN